MNLASLLIEKFHSVVELVVPYDQNSYFHLNSYLNQNAILTISLADPEYFSFGSLNFLKMLEVFLRKKEEETIKVYYAFERYFARHCVGLVQKKYFEVVQIKWVS